MNNLLTIGQASGALIAILTLGGMLVNWGIVKPIKGYIEKMTYPIQPHANGGRSLPDLVNSVDDLKYLVMTHLKEHDTPVK